jgi:hypothetical protein
MNRSILAVLAAAAAAVALAMPASAQDTPPLPRMMKEMEKGEWRMEILEDSESKGRTAPAMVMCTDNVLRARHHHATLGEAKCARRLLKDDSDEAVMEMTCPDSAVTTAMKRENAKDVLADVKRTGTQPRTLKVRYTRLGACQPGERPGLRFERDSERCKEMRASVASMDPKQCQGPMREQCEQMMQQRVEQARSMCGV